MGKRIGETNSDTLLKQLANDWGYSDPLDMIDCIGLLATPAICTNWGCGYTTDSEPDASNNWCECCQTRTVASALVLAGMI